MSQLIGKLNRILVTPLKNGGMRVNEIKNMGTADGRSAFSPSTEYEMEDVEMYWDEATRIYSIVGTRLYEEFVTTHKEAGQDLVWGTEDKSKFDRFLESEVTSKVEKKGWPFFRKPVTIYKLKKEGWNKLKKTEKARLQTPWLSVERFEQA